MQFCVILIHGTYAKDARWTKPETSKLCKYLETQFGEDVQFDRFGWKAPNRHEARSEASRQLLEEYQNQKTFFRRQGIPHFLIAHSHGGSVLAYALRENPVFARTLAGVAFLSTPFIQARERLTTRWVLKLLPWVIATLVFFVTIFLLLIVYAKSVYPAPLPVAVTLVSILVVAVVALLSFSVAKVIIALPEAGLPDKLKLLVRKVVSELDLSALKSGGLNEKTLIVRTNGDEASSTLASAHIIARLLAEIPARIARLPSAVGEFVSSKWGAMLRRQKEKPTLRFKATFGVLLLGALFLFTAIPTFRWLSGNQHFESNWPVLSQLDGIAKAILFEGIYMGTIYSLLVIAFVSVSLAILAMPIIALLFRVAYGRWLLLPALFIELSVEPTPPGEWPVSQLDLHDELTPPNPRDAFLLSHSMSYDDPRAHKVIADWIRRRLPPEPAIASN
jgi:hypothetical protein